MSLLDNILFENYGTENYDDVRASVSSLEYEFDNVDISKFELD